MTLLGTMATSENGPSLFMNQPKFSGAIECIVKAAHHECLMAKLGFSTARIDYKMDPKASIVGHVCMAIVDPHHSGCRDSLAVLAFFGNNTSGEIMMADGSEFPYSCLGKADLTVVRILRKALPKLGENLRIMRMRVVEDIQAASGRRSSKSSSRSTSTNNSPIRDSKDSEKKSFANTSKSLFHNSMSIAHATPAPSNSFPPPSKDVQFRISRTRPIISPIVINTGDSTLPSSTLPGCAGLQPEMPRSGREKQLRRTSPQPKSKAAPFPSTIANGKSVNASHRRQPPPNQFKCSVFVSHIASGASWHDIQSAFSAQVAPTLRVYMKPGCSWAHVYFYDLDGVEKAIEAAAAGMIKICGRPARVRRRTRKKKVKRNQGEHPMREESPPTLSRSTGIPGTNSRGGYQLNSQECAPNDNFYSRGGLSKPHISSPPSSFQRGQSTSPPCRERRLKQDRIRQPLSCHGNNTSEYRSDGRRQHYCTNESRIGSSSLFMRNPAALQSPPLFSTSGYFPNDQQQQLLLHRNKKNDNHTHPLLQQKPQRQTQHIELLPASSRRNYSSMDRLTSGLESIRLMQPGVENSSSMTSSLRCNIADFLPPNDLHHKSDMLNTNRDGRR